MRKVLLLGLMLVLASAIAFGQTSVTGKVTSKWRSHTWRKRSGKRYLNRCRYRSGWQLLTRSAGGWGSFDLLIYWYGLSRRDHWR